MTIKEIMQKRKAGMPDGATSKHGRSFMTKYQCKNARILSDILGYELRDLQANCPHTHTLINPMIDFWHHFELNETYNDWGIFLAPVPRQRTLGDTVLCAFQLSTKARLPTSRDLVSCKEHLVQKIYACVGGKWSAWTLSMNAASVQSKVMIVWTGVVTCCWGRSTQR